MISIAEYAEKIQKTLQDEKVEKFKIFVRINYTLDVYIFTATPLPVKHYSDLLGVEDSILDTLKVNYKVLSLDDLDEPFYSNIFVDGENDIDWGPRYRFNSLLRSGKSSEAQLLKSSLDRIASLKIPIVTFYSYKGGMGRTTTMVAYAMDLAINHKKKVVIIDCDLEAPGYLNFFDLSEHDGLKSGKTNGLVEFLSDSMFMKDSEGLDVNDYMINVGYGNDSNKAAYDYLTNIWLVPAGNLNEDFKAAESFRNRKNYLEGLSRQNLSSINLVVDGFLKLFVKLKDSVSPDVILVDSRTGFNDIFGTVAFYLSKYVVGFFGFNRQTAPGLMNLLSEYYNAQNHFGLHIVSSILPADADAEWIDKKKQEIYSYANLIGNEGKALPEILCLHRNSVLERIGTGDSRSDEQFVEIIRGHQFEDFNILFGKINEHIEQLFPKKKKATLNISVNTPALDLRNIVLRSLKEKLRTVTTFAEDGEINEERFFYRECMKELFDPKKFLIQGYKGTGKTYLYKALASGQISNNIQKMVALEGRSSSKPVDVCKFINVLPEKGGYNFKAIKYNTIEEPDYYFNCFWQIFTWNAILLDPLFAPIKEKSELKNEVGEISSNEAVKRFERLIEDGVDTLIVLENDFKRINEFLQAQHIKLFVMYDRLDSCINPLRWNKAVSPLIDYWRENWDTYSNIIPKVFVRTDLFNRVEGTNTARLSSNFISLEWSIGEVFGYFFKQLFSDEETARTYWIIAEKAGVNSDYINKRQNEFKNNFNQFKSLLRADMDPLIKVFFGKEVTPNNAHLGSPWDYFEQNLANADRKSISLRPFIKMLDGNAIDQALAKTERYVTEIISPDIYASRKVRIDTADYYFKDLAQDAYSTNILKLRDYINSNDGEPYRFKSLKEAQFENLMKEVFKKVGDEDPVIKSIDDLWRLIEANGIMAEKITTGGKFYRFAPIYWYAWGLGNSEFEKRESREKKKSTPRVNQTKDLKGEYDKRNHWVITADEKRYFAKKFSDPEVYNGADVLFDIELDPTKGPNFYNAVNIRFDE